MMEDFSRLLLEKLPIRLTREQKRRFLTNAMDCFSSMGYACQVQQGKWGGILSENLIVGNIDKADVIFLTHYDTPRTRVFAPPRYPGRRGLNCLLTIWPALLLLLVTCGFVTLLSLPWYAGEAIFLLGLWLLYYAAPNQSNVNGSGSGLLALYQLAAQKPGAAFVLLDNQDVLRLGKKTFLKGMQSRLSGKTLVFVACVGDGEDCLITYTPEAAPWAQQLQGAEKRPVRGKRKECHVFATYQNKWGRYIPPVKNAQDTVLRQSTLEQTVRLLEECLCK